MINLLVMQIFTVMDLFVMTALDFAGKRPADHCSRCTRSLQKVYQFAITSYRTPKLYQFVALKYKKNI